MVYRKLACFSQLFPPLVFYCKARMQPSLLSYFCMVKLDTGGNGRQWHTAKRHWALWHLEKGLISYIQHNDTQYNNTLPLYRMLLYWLSRFICCYVECFYAECRCTVTNIMAYHSALFIKSFIVMQTSFISHWYLGK